MPIEPHARARLPLAAWLTALCLAPLLVHSPELLGLVHTDPLLFVSKLARTPASSLLGGQPFIDGNAGETTLALGGLAADDWLSGLLPWWNPYTGVGVPLASEMQPAAFFLPFVLLLHFASGVLYLKIALQVLAGLGMFGFLRSLGLARWACCLAACLFQMNGTFAWYGDAPSFPIAFLPLLLWAIEHACALALAGRRGGQTWIALAIAYSLVAGFPETAFLDGLLALAWTAMRAGGLARTQAWALLGKVMAGGIAGLLLAAPCVVPFLLDLRLSSLGAHDYSAAQHLGAQHLAGLMFPYLFGPIFADLDFEYWIRLGGYTGLVLPLLALLGALGLGSGARRVMAGWGAIMLAAIFGVPLVTQAVRLLPGVGTSYLCRYGMPSAEFALCVLAGCALDDFARAIRPRLAHVAGLALGTAGLLALLLAFDKLLVDLRHTPGAATVALLSLAWGIGGACGVAWLLGRPPTHRIRLALGALVAADAMILLGIPTLSGLTDGALKTGPTAYLQSHQGLARAISTDRTLFPNAGAWLREGVVSYEYTPVPTSWADYVNTGLDPAALPTSMPGPGETDWTSALNISDHYRAFAAIGVRYVVAPTAMKMFQLAMPPNKPVRVFSDGDEDVLELPGAAPYAEAVGGDCKLSVRSRTTMHAECGAEGLLLRRELFFPGWHVRMNGRPASIVQHDSIFQAVALPAGPSEIVFSYRPPFSRTIWLMFAMGVAALLACVAPARRARWPGFP